jgi:predicted dehydrogenase
LVSKVPRGAVIGCGGIARLRHIPAFREAARSGLAEIVAICDPVETTLAAARDEFGISACYADWRDVVARDDIDLVTIATPNSLHEPIAIAALQSGKHVMCEKPLALSLAGARRMAEAARDSGLVTAVNHRYRWVPAARYLQELVAAGEAGEVRQIFMFYCTRAKTAP